MTRILVAFDFDDASPFVAYAQLRALLRMLPVEKPWETMDEWYDGDGERVPQEVIDAACEAYEEPEAPEPAVSVTLRPLDVWDHADGDVLWWKLPVEEPPYCGTPGDSDWPGYHTHWTPLSVPAEVG